VQDYKSSNHKSNGFEPPWLTHAHIDTGDVNKNLSFKVKAKPKDLTYKAKASRPMNGPARPNKGLTWQGNKIGAYASYRFILILCIRLSVVRTHNSIVVQRRLRPRAG